jgi:hypothetical protein
MRQRQPDEQDRGRPNSRGGSFAHRPWFTYVAVFALVAGAALALVLKLERTRVFEAEHTDWQPVQMPDRQSKVWMPANPVVSRRATREGDATIETTELRWMSRNGSTVFGCIQNDIPGTLPLGDEPGILGSLARQTASAASMKIVGEDPIRLDRRWNGREVRLVSEKGSYGVVRYYIIGRRIYQLQAIVPTARSQSPLVQGFLDSFVYTPR